MEIWWNYINAGGFFGFWEKRGCFWKLIFLRVRGKMGR
jgi:hypothetical protein